MGVRGLLPCKDQVAKVRGSFEGFSFSALVQRKTSDPGCGGFSGRLRVQSDAVKRSCWLP